MVLISCSCIEIKFPLLCSLKCSRLHLRISVKLNRMQEQNSPPFCPFAAMIATFCVMKKILFAAMHEKPSERRRPARVQ